MNINTIGYWFIESLEGIKKNRKTFFVGLGTMIVVLCIIGTLYILNINANAFMGDIKEDETKVNIYFRGLTRDEVTIVMGQLYQIDGIKDVEYIDELQAYEKAKEMMPTMINPYTAEENVLPESFTITVDGNENGSVANVEQAVLNLELLKDKIEGTDGFDGAEKTIKIAKSVEIITITVLILVTVMGCFLMMNSIKLALYARRKEISIMKYVGATDRFTRAPFIIEGLIIALIAAGITLLITNFIYGGLLNITSSTLLFSFLVPKEAVFSSLTLLLLGIGVGIGTIGSAMSISKYLDV